MPGKNLMTVALLAVFAVICLATAILAVHYVQLSREWSRLKAPIEDVTHKQALARNLVVEVANHARNNPRVLPVLRTNGFVRTSTLATP